MPYELGPLTVYHYGEIGSGFEDRASSAQEYDTLKANCLAEGRLFDDDEFPPNISSVYAGEPRMDIEWVRAIELDSSAQFISDGVSRFDVNQGSMGDCWFIASVANLTLNHRVFNRVVPAENSFQDDYCGIFHFRFWQYGRWVDVVVDDYLPTSDGELVFMRSTERGEFWSALLEKAYAKLHGSYDALDGGLNIEALEDFTGGLAERFDLSEAPGNLFHIMKKAYERSSLIGSAVNGTGRGESAGPYGLVCGHAYTVTAVVKVDINDEEISLVRVRNPWGNDIEWTGPWSDNSAEWNALDDDQKEALELNHKDDGEFWMSFGDFVYYFSVLDICHLGPHTWADEDEGTPAKKWEMQIYEDAWVKGVTAGGCINFMQSFIYNPQFTIEIIDPDPDDDEDQCTLIVALMQKSRRANRSQNVAIGFSLYRIDGEDATKVSKPLRTDFFRYNRRAVDSPPFCNSREICSRFRLYPGKYCIIPSCFHPNVEGEFLLRVYSETSNPMELNDIEVPMEVNEEVDRGDVELPEEIIEAFNAKESEEIVLEDLQEILQQHFKVEFEFRGFDESTCRLLVRMVGADEDAITLEKLSTIWNSVQNCLDAFLRTDEDGSGHLDLFELWPALLEAGFKINGKTFRVLLQKFGDEESCVYFEKYIVCYILLWKLKALMHSENIGTGEDFSFEEWLDCELAAL